ncbi:MAG: Na+/H+ antiporter, partial [uncultured Rubrobacteraceae bacterium]
GPDRIAHLPARGGGVAGAVGARSSDSVPDLPGARRARARLRAGAADGRDTARGDLRGLPAAAPELGRLLLLAARPARAPEGDLAAGHRPRARDDLRGRRRGPLRRRALVAAGIRARGDPLADGPRGGRGDLPPPRRARARRHGRRRREPHKRRHGPRGLPAGRWGRGGDGGLLAHRGRAELSLRRRGRRSRRPRLGLHHPAPLEPPEGRLDPDNLLRPDPVRRLHPRGGAPARLRHPRRGHLRPRARVEVTQALHRRLHAHPGPRVLGRAGLCAGGAALRPARPATPLYPREPRGVHGTGGPVLRRSGLRRGVGGAPGLLLYGALSPPRLRPALPQQVPARHVAGVPGDELERDAGRGLVGGGPHRPRRRPLRRRPRPDPLPHLRCDPRDARPAGAHPPLPHKGARPQGRRGRRQARGAAGPPRGRPFGAAAPGEDLRGERPPRGERAGDARVLRGPHRPLRGRHRGRGHDRRVRRELRRLAPGAPRPHRGRAGRHHPHAGRGRDQPRDHAPHRTRPRPGRVPHRRL